MVAAETDGANRGRKYPFLADQIFGLEIDSIIAKFFEAPPAKTKIEMTLPKVEKTVEEPEVEVEVLDLDESEFENPNADVIKKEITESETLDPKEDEVNSEK